MDWHRTAKARHILAQMAATPPDRLLRSKIYALTREDWWEYQGPLVDRLAAIRDAHGARILRRCQLSGRYSALTRWSAIGTVHEVIADRLEGARHKCRKAAA